MKPYNSKTTTPTEGRAQAKSGWASPMARRARHYLESASKDTGIPAGCLSVCLGIAGKGAKAELWANGEALGEVPAKALARILLPPLPASLPGAGFVAARMAREYVKHLSNATGTPTGITRVVVWASNGEALATAILGVERRKAVPFSEMEAFFTL